MRILVTALTYIASLFVTTIAAFFFVIILVGPHAGLLPSWLEAIVLGLGWLAVLILPVLIARKVWRRSGQA
jgi:hypothetical protein